MAKNNRFRIAINTGGGDAPGLNAVIYAVTMAAESASFSSRKRTLSCPWSARLIEVMTSTPSMPAIESSSGLVTCDSITSADAPA